MTAAHQIATITFAIALGIGNLCGADPPGAPVATGSDNAWLIIAPLFHPPPNLATNLGSYRSPLLFSDGRRATTPMEWQARRQEILRTWEGVMGSWPRLIEKPKIDYLETTERDKLQQHKVRIEIAPGQTTTGYLLMPPGRGPFPAVIVPYYEPESSIGISKVTLRDFAYQLSQRGFVSLAIGSPGGDARRPNTGEVQCQPLSFLAYVAANCLNALATLPQVDPQRIGIVGHSYGGKWAMFASCLYERFACAAWSDPGIVFDEKRSNVNYWEPWYLGLDPAYQRQPGIVTAENPRTGAYKKLIESGHDLHELHALMAPRPFLVSGGSEDLPERWQALNHSRTVNDLLGKTNRVAMTSRAGHNPTVESNEQIYRFFEHFLRPSQPTPSSPQ